MSDTTEPTSPPETAPQGPSYEALEASLRQAHDAIGQLQAVNASLLEALKSALLAGGTLARVRE
tara:strand:- start:310 stop:501 length:192 start_codon:yes stop_codon:yes gene_type:complete